MDVQSASLAPINNVTRRLYPDNLKATIYFNPYYLGYQKTKSEQPHKTTELLLQKMTLDDDNVRSGNKYNIEPKSTYNWEENFLDFIGNLQYDVMGSSEIDNNSDSRNFCTNIGVDYIKKVLHGSHIIIVIQHKQTNQVVGFVCAAVTKNNGPTDFDKDERYYNNKQTRLGQFRNYKNKLYAAIKQVMTYYTWMHVNLICTHKEFSGVGRHMIQIVESIARSLDCYGIDLDAVPNAIGFYTKLDYIPYGIVPMEKILKTDQELKEDRECSGPSCVISGGTRTRRRRRCRRRTNRRHTKRKFI